MAFIIAIHIMANPFTTKAIHYLVTQVKNKKEVVLPLSYHNKEETQPFPLVASPLMGHHTPLVVSPLEVSPLVVIPYPLVVVPYPLVTIP